MERQESTAGDEQASYLVKFYLGQAKDAHGRYIHEVQAWPHEQLEYVHNYIQWLFPTTRIGVDPTAPLVGEADKQAFRADERLQKALLRSLDVMLGFYGFKLDGVPGAITISRSDDWKTRKRNWVTRGNHNFLRITRILTTLCLFGQEEYAGAFFERLSDVYQSEAQDVIGAHTYQYWRSAAEGHQ